MDDIAKIKYKLYFDKSPTKYLCNNFKNKKYLSNREICCCQGFKTKGCCISPILFKIYATAILKMWKRKIYDMGVELNDSCFYFTIFADD